MVSLTGLPLSLPVALQRTAEWHCYGEDAGLASLSSSDVHTALYVFRSGGGRWFVRCTMFVSYFA